MSISTNDTKRLTLYPDESKLSQFPFFDERTYLRSEVGNSFETLAELFGVTPTSVGANWLGNNPTQLRIGNKNNSLERVYRNLKVNNISIKRLMDGRQFNCFPFTMLKLGQSYNASDTKEQIAIKYDQSQVNQVEFQDLDMSYLFSYGNTWTQINIDNCNLRFCYFERTNFKNFAFEKTDFFQIAFGYPNNPDLTEWFAGVLTDCKFISCNLSQVNTNLGGTLFTNVEFIGCTIRFDVDETELRIAQSYDCNYFASNLQFLMAYAERCSFMYVQATFGDVNKLGNFFDCLFRLATITNPEIGYLVNCNFDKTTFTGTLTLASTASVKGCDFTDSNLNTVTGGYATKQAFMDALDALGTNRYDQTTIWVDGTSLTEV